MALERTCYRNLGSLLRGFRTTASALLILASLACGKPAVEPRPMGGRSLLVHLDCPGCEPGGDLDARYGEALRDRLSNQARVLPPGHPEADEALTLVVRLRVLDGRSEVVRQAAGRGFQAGFQEGWKSSGKTGGGLKDAAFDLVAGVVVGTFFGLVAAPVNAATAETRALYHNARLGYKPRHVVVQVALVETPGGPERQLFETTAFDVVKAMQPMSNAEAREPGRLAREEAGALARVVSERMARDYGWQPERSAMTMAGKPDFD